ncbi:hypothetical protein G7B40_021870 [Aetokthonos hydrillicola Thurmond2011]|jgi:hypothetical protein|uniref:Uncharacterized protein n=1 Tax=Aetokthonos hydrillicola Thurmond2011 TaxID=2712845 RepID=A0AAP5IBS5_9CYAN|nr:hypothetical protein [Aetokthonos hydrillicola]MBO3457816.1 hypothetical protein [Aetokthonos hydrillicola CCALA 1050]MBW4588326.1 hypothetical protein [Aetokthonos hydrillicola CCALA 1050]MDR9897192.1 hypothetical protein [Aetokthonos hydrillicola Thurmond2011]
MNLYQKALFVVATSVISVTTIQANRVFAASFDFDFILKPFLGPPANTIAGQGNLTFDDDSLVGVGQEIKPLSSLKGATFNFDFQPDAVRPNFQNAGTITETNITEPAEFIFENGRLTNISFMARKTIFVDANQISSRLQTGRFVPIVSINDQLISLDFTSFTVIMDENNPNSVNILGEAIGDFAIRKVDTNVRSVNEPNSIVGYCMALGLSVLFFKKNNFGNKLAFLSRNKLR